MEGYVYKQMTGRVFFFFSSRRRPTGCREVSLGWRCGLEAASVVILAWTVGKLP